MDSNQLTRAYFDQIQLIMRHIGSRKPDTAMRLFGETFLSPVMTAALSHMDEQCPNGSVSLATGAKMAGCVHWFGMGEDEELERLTATGARVIKIIKPHADNSEVFRKLEHAQKAGAFAVGMDIDHAFSHTGDYDVVRGLPMKPKSEDELRAFVSATPLPFIIKGVLSVRDAQIAARVGAKGIVVSHHHGIMDSCVPPLRVLPSIAKAVNGQLELFADCGIASGSDAFKALALGAKAVCVGRAVIPAVKEHGAEGARDFLTQMTRQLAGMMARTGCATPDEIDESCVFSAC